MRGTWTTVKPTRIIKRMLKHVSLAAMIGLSACGDGGSSDPTTSTPSQLELYSWWVNPGETTTEHLHETFEGADLAHLTSNCAGTFH